MSATSQPIALVRPSRSHVQFLLRRLHSLTGLAFGGYLLIHLFVNSTIVQSTVYLGGIYQVNVNLIHSLPQLWAWEWGLIYLPILYHIVYGVWIIATGQPNTVNYPYGKNWLYLLQRISAVILAIFIFYHVLALSFHIFGPSLAFNPAEAAASTHQHLVSHPVLTWIIYPIGILAACFHLSNGLFTAAVTWGLAVSASGQRRWGYFCVLIFLVALTMGTVALLGGYFLPLGPVTT